MARSGTDKTWLETVLRSNLKRVSAPDELWDRVVLPRVDARQTLSRPSLWMIAAASALTASVFAAAWGYYPRRMNVSEFELLAKHGAEQGNPQMEFRSDRVAEVREWVRHRIGLEIPLLAQPSIAMIGARVVESGGPVVEIRYQAEGKVFVLLASRTGDRAPGTMKHADLGNAPLQNTRAVSWTMAGQAYTLAGQSAEGLHAACLVCHSDSSL